MSAVLKPRGGGLWPASVVECGRTRLSQVKGSINEGLLSVETEVVSGAGVSPAVMEKPGALVPRKLFLPLTPPQITRRASADSGTPRPRKNSRAASILPCNQPRSSRRKVQLFGRAETFSSDLCCPRWHSQSPISTPTLGLAQARFSGLITQANASLRCCLLSRSK